MLWIRWVKVSIEELCMRVVKTEFANDAIANETISMIQLEDLIN